MQGNYNVETENGELVNTLSKTLGEPVEQDKDGIQIMKDYMASGSFARGKEEKAASASQGKGTAQKAGRHGVLRCQFLVH